MYYSINEHFTSSPELEKAVMLMHFPDGTYPKDFDVVQEDWGLPQSWEMIKLPSAPLCANVSAEVKRPVTAVASFGKYLYLIGSRYNLYVVAGDDKDEAEQYLLEYLYDHFPSLFCTRECVLTLSAGKFYTYTKYEEEDTWYNGTFNTTKFEDA